MDMSVSYLGLKLAHPFLPGASPMVDDLGTVRRLEDAGASAIVMHSVFEEQITSEQIQAFRSLETHAGSFPEAQSFFPGAHVFALGPDEYLEQIRRIKRAVSVPVIASLNGVSAGGWLDHAKWIEQAGADALELNLYHLPSDPNAGPEAVEGRLEEIVRIVRGSVRIPIAAKLSPFFTSLPNFARKLTEAGADGLVLFNRFYQPDIDVETLEVRRELKLSDSTELLLRLRWLAILSGRTASSLAVSGGVHTPMDAVKAILCGAQAVQMVSALLKYGPEHLRAVKEGAEAWMREHGYESVRQMCGSMSLLKCPDPSAYERGNYMRLLQSWWAT